MDLSISWIRKTVGTALKRWTSVDSESAKQPEWYLNRATECLEQAQRINSGSDGSPSVKVFRMQCDYLVQKLESAVNVSTGTYRNSTPSRKHKSRHHEIPKLLYWLAIQVQGFVDDCCKDDHMQAALTAALVPMRVRSLGIQLELYRTALSCNINSLLADEPASLSQENLKSLRETEKHEVETRASCDKDNLLHSLRSLIELGKSSSAQGTVLDTLKSLITSHTSSKADRNFQLATMVLNRLDASQAVSTSGPTRSLSLKAWKVDGKNLRRLQELGKGGSAIVYKSEWLGSVIVAEKVFLELSDFDAFEREISLLATLSHPSILSILGYWKGEKSSAIVTELMDGDLTDLMAERLKPGMPPFSISVACDTMLQIAEGVDYIHEKGVSHRDLKSQNVLVRRSKDDDIEYVCAKVADFGLSKNKESTMACTHMTSNTGTSRYIAPELMGVGMEQIRERDKLHPRKSDVYSFGMLCFEIFTGEVPFKDISIPRYVKEKVKAGERPRLPPECPEELRSLIELCWHHEPNERPYMSEVCEQLRRIKYSLLLEDPKSEVRVSAAPPEWYLDKIKQCMEHVQQMTSGPLPDSTGVKMYHRQCQFLEGELKLAVEVCCQSSSGQLGILRLLLVLATQIKGFIDDCCNKEWVKAALISPSVAPAPSVIVSTLGFYLKLTYATVLPDDSQKLGATQLLESLREDVERAVAKEARLDEQNLLNALQSLIVSSKSRSWEAILPGMSRNVDRIQLATILQKKLEASQLVSTRSPQHPTETYLTTDPSTIKRMRKLGRGTEATVYSGIWFGAEVAVKTYYGGADYSFQEEVSKLGSLCHPNIVNILGYSHDDREYNILMDLMDGGLDSFMARRLDMQSRRDMVPFNIDEAVDLMLQVANGVNYLHEHEIVHRDLKSSNILVKQLTRSEKDIPDFLSVKVAGLGLSARTRDHSSEFCSALWVQIEKSKRHWNELCDEERSKGHCDEERSKGHCDEERSKTHCDEERSKGHCDEERSKTHWSTLRMKSDVTYSFGLLCYEILTGVVPFSKVDVLPPQCPSALETLIQACWHANPSDRPSFKQICQELRYLKYTLLLKESSGESSAQQRYQLARPVAEAQLKVQNDLLEHLSRLSVTKIEYSCLNRGIQLGRGGSETVVYETIYQGSNLAEKRSVTAYNKDFKRELTVLADFEHHPNIVKLIGFAMANRSCSIIMEKMHGDLHDLMRKRMTKPETTPTGPFSLKDAVHIMLQIAQGMHYVHQKNVVHRDLKSYNILVQTTSNRRQPGHVVKVADFGLSEKLKPGFNPVRFNIGTVSWMAPEVMMLQNDVNVGKSPRTRTGQVYSKFLYFSNALGNISLMSDKQVKNYPDPFKSDIYSFGIVCFEILTGCPPTFHLNKRGGGVFGEEPIKAAVFLLFLLLEGLDKLRNNPEKVGVVPLLLLERLNINKDPVKAILVLLLLRIKFEKNKDKNEALKEKVMAGHRPRLPKYCPPKLKALIKSCWDKDASSRPSFAQIVEDLNDVL
ncbi:hypothetical protein KC19_8G157600 [Ceratodon purpureus]|uniref:Protein kinase domain-containing protein n=1 Tax=Ceratodon purpureus TaxID=3225 RepID=A0A8T0H3W5_CERPU|nr:hypothetical protein KC19_8G157600 [Ceratodon purpureus]